MNDDTQLGSLARHLDRIIPDADLSSIAMREAIAVESKCFARSVSVSVEKLAWQFASRVPLAAAMADTVLKLRPGSRSPVDVPVIVVGLKPWPVPF
jgi:hypothetical protein